MTASTISVLAGAIVMRLGHLTVQYPDFTCGG